jgi:hypothetical protein
VDVLMFLYPSVWSRVSGLMRFHDGSNKGTTSVHKILYNDAAFLSRVITGHKSWIYGYDPETKQQSSQWKIPNSPRPNKAGQAKSKVRSMFSIFFDIKGIDCS